MTPRVQRALGRHDNAIEKRGNRDGEMSDGSQFRLLNFEYRSKCGLRLIISLKGEFWILAFSK